MMDAVRATWNMGVLEGTPYKSGFGEGDPRYDGFGGGGPA